MISCIYITLTLWLLHNKAYAGLISSRWRGFIFSCLLMCLARLRVLFTVAYAFKLNVSDLRWWFWHFKNKIRQWHQRSAPCKLLECICVCGRQWMSSFRSLFACLDSGNFVDGVLKCPLCARKFCNKFGYCTHIKRTIGIIKVMQSRGWNRSRA